MPIRGCYSRIRHPGQLFSVVGKSTGCCGQKDAVGIVDDGGKKGDDGGGPGPEGERRKGLRTWVLVVTVGCPVNFARQTSCVATEIRQQQEVKKKILKKTTQHESDCRRLWRCKGAISNSSWDRASFSS